MGKLPEAGGGVFTAFFPVKNMGITRRITFFKKGLQPLYVGLDCPKTTYKWGFRRRT
jgi:hypothetical protein